MKGRSIILALSVGSLVLSEDESEIVSGLMDGTVRIWNIENDLAYLATRFYYGGGDQFGWQETCVSLNGIHRKNMGCEKRDTNQRCTDWSRGFSYQRHHQCRR